MFNNYNYFTMNNLETILESDTEGAQVLEPEMLDNSSSNYHDLEGEDGQLLMNYWFVCILT